MGAFLLCPNFLTPSASAGDPVKADPATVFGVVHSNGKYYLTSEDFLNEGADQVLATGTKVIKLQLSPSPYPWNSTWPKGSKQLPLQ